MLSDHDSILYYMISYQFISYGVVLLPPMINQIRPEAGIFSSLKIWFEAIIGIVAIKHERVQQKGTRWGGLPPPPEPPP